jgi:hypothetical protein
VEVPQHQDGSLDTELYDNVRVVGIVYVDNNKTFLALAMRHSTISELFPVRYQNSNDKIGESMSQHLTFFHAVMHRYVFCLWRPGA